jgi:hypothetical protein
LLIATEDPGNLVAEFVVQQGRGVGRLLQAVVTDGRNPGKPADRGSGKPVSGDKIRGVGRVGVGVPHEVDDDVGFAGGELNVGYVDDLRQRRRRWGEGYGPGADQRDTGDNVALRLSRRWLRWTGHHFCTSSRTAYDG